ncbi:ISAon1 family transposase N-terminal region protein [Pedobacter gandavensis]|uniref:Transposase n=1 Tax=Pedobacter gandavensis TaxID=2679963 RepID=A0ABR6F2Z2_9SPHI|nr:transposase [Pedobacter gandavensis]MBB2151881.1 transposase [Pedobacter gandavensis]
MSSATVSLLKLFVPDFIVENFDFKRVFEDSETIDFELKELNTPPTEWDGIKVFSKGVLPQIVIQHIPIRGHRIFYHIIRCRWLNNESSKVIYLNWTLVEKGTRITREFAAFLKEINLYSAE